MADKMRLKVIVVVVVVDGDDVVVVMGFTSDNKYEGECETEGMASRRLSTKSSSSDAPVGIPK